MMLVALVSMTFTSCSKDDDDDPAMVGTWNCVDNNTNEWEEGYYSGYYQTRNVRETTNETWNLTLNSDGSGTLTRTGSYTKSTSTDDNVSWNLSYNFIYTIDPEKNDQYGNMRIAIVSVYPDPDKMEAKVRNHIGSVYTVGQQIDQPFSVANNKLSILGHLFTRQ